MHRTLGTITVFYLSLILVDRALGARPDSVIGSEGFKLTAADWPWWRGPQRNGVADASAMPPLRWSQSENVLWKTEIPGRGHSSPTLVGGQIFLTTADDEAQYVLCFDAHNGVRQWMKEIHRGGLPQEKNERSSHASSTVACDGEQLYANFMQNGAVFTTALRCTGEQLWQTKISDYVVHQGYGSSPALYDKLVIVSADNKSGGAIAALDRASGEVVWKHARPQMPNYPSPIILPIGGRDQLLMTGCELLNSFDPSSGVKLWEVAGATTECVTTTVTNGELIYSSGGFPDNHVAATRADGTGELVWENTTRVYVPSMLVKGDYLYAVADAGVAICWNSHTGKQMWKGRLAGHFSSSPVLVGDRIYATNEDGTTFVYQASPAAFELLTSNQLGDEVFATPTISGGRIFARIAFREGDDRQEMLVCLGATE